MKNKWRKSEVESQNHFMKTNKINWTSKIKKTKTKWKMKTKCLKDKMSIWITLFSQYYRNIQMIFSNYNYPQKVWIHKRKWFLLKDIGTWHTQVWLKYLFKLMTILLKNSKWKHTTKKIYIHAIKYLDCTWEMFVGK